MPLDYETDDIALLSDDIKHHQHLRVLPEIPEPAAPAGLYVAAWAVWFRVGYTCQCVAESLPLVEADMVSAGLIRSRIDIYQLQGSAGPSAGTHAKGGCADVAQDSPAQIECWRDWGWTMQARTRAQGFMPHAHGWPFGCGHLSPAALAQLVQWRNRQNGLVSRGPIAGKWPVDTWTKARDRKENEMPSANEVADAVLTLDGKIPNEFTGNPDNKDVSLATAIQFLGKRTRAMEVREKAMEAKLNQLLTLVKGMQK